MIDSIKYGVYIDSMGNGSFSFLRYRLVRESDGTGDYSVYAINHRGDGEIYEVLFSGPKSRERAREYLDWINGKPTRPARQRSRCISAVSGARS